mmetsp:Transcript_60801/g.159894  ORF Transcript_60801/g.159894 Transcript_60801/m.159894 type:complete len:331 (-) Transcript_60801:221-1213(-)
MALHLQVVPDELDEDQGEYRERVEEQHEAPHEGEAGVEEGDDHNPQISEHLDHAQQAEDAGEPQSAQRAQERQLQRLLAHDGVDGGPDAGQDDEQVHDVPAHVFVAEEVHAVHVQLHHDLEQEVYRVRDLNAVDGVAGLLSQVPHGGVLAVHDEGAVGDDHERGEHLELDAGVDSGRKAHALRLLELVPPLDAQRQPLQRLPLSSLTVLLLVGDHHQPAQTRLLQVQLPRRCPGDRRRGERGLRALALERFVLCCDLHVPCGVHRGQGGGKLVRLRAALVVSRIGRVLRQGLGVLPRAGPLLDLRRQDPVHAGPSQEVLHQAVLLRQVVL